MPAFSLEEIVKATGAGIVQQGKACFSDVVTDTRKITEGVLFIALRGERFNGEDFAGEALAKGAAGVVVSTACPEDKIPGAGGTVLKVEDTQRAYQQIAHL